MSDALILPAAGKTPNERLAVQALYLLHTVAWASMGTLAVIALIVNYVLRGDETDPVYLNHHTYMIRTFWWTVFWLVLTSPLWFLLAVFLPLGPLAYAVIGFWYLYRCIRGWLYFNKGKLA